MRRILILISILSAAVVVPATATSASVGATDGAVVRDWTNLAFAAVRDAKATDAAAARLYAMVDGAMYDAVNGLSSHPKWSAFIAPSTGNDGDPAVAAATAAHAILTNLFPRLATTYDAQLASDVAGAQSPGQAKHGAEWGTRVANAVLAARANDGSSPAESRGPVNEVGKFRGTFNGRQYRNLAPFAIANPAAYETATVPALDSPEYAASFNEVKARGRDDGDAAAKATFDFWALGSGSNQPAGAWLQVAEAAAVQRELSLDDTARLFALESMALADTVAPTYMVKDLNYHWRPVDAIREAALDGNAATEPYAGTWKARGGSAGSPEFWSGHSTFSSAGATVLAQFLCTDEVTFTLTTDSGAGASRTYASFSQAALEAGDSRVIGGLHFPFSNFTAADAGKAIATEVMQREPAC
jgi:hypothetical protein